MMRWLVGLGFILCALALSCTKSASNKGTSQAPSEDLRAVQLAIRESLLSPQQLPRIMWRQQLRVKMPNRAFVLEVVLQNDGTTFQVLGLTSMNTRLFLIEQTSNTIRHQKFVEQDVPLLSEFLLLDIQRTFFWQNDKTVKVLPRQSAQKWFFRGYAVTDEWRGSALVRRLVTDPSNEGLGAEGRLEIDYVPSFSPGSPPKGAILVHQKRGYKIEIVQLQSDSLP